MELIHRHRRLRESAAIRQLVAENKLHLDDFIYPLFAVNGEGIRDEIGSLPGNYHLSVDVMLEEVAEISELGIKGILLFGLPDSKDDIGSRAWAENGIVQQACQQIKQHFPEMLVITDVCLCQYTSHGHCGILKDGFPDNDLTIDRLAQVAVSHARAGADMVAPSDMMDGRVARIREALDEEGFTDIGIMAYSAKYASAFYGPFRQAAHSAPEHGDRRGYQMDPPNLREALREVRLDIEEGADIVMVKPALAYLDVIREVGNRFDCPLAVYNVSGEYAMIKAAAEKQLVDEKNVVVESLTAMKRAGADLIITYWAKDAARWLGNLK